jgi:hypothetical protein
LFARAICATVGGFAFSIFVLVEIVQLFALDFIAHSQINHPPSS